MDELLMGLLYVGLLVVGAVWLKMLKTIREDMQQYYDDERDGDDHGNRREDR